jgi:flagellar motor switch protein FliG
MPDLSAIQGPQKVAAFLLALEPAVASSILKGMPTELAVRVAEAMMDLDPRLTQPGVREELVRALALDLNRPRALHACDAERLKRLLGEAFGRQSDELLRQIHERRLASRPFLELEARTPLELAEVLREESPAVAALVLAHLDPTQSAQVLKHFAEETALDIVRRMVRLEVPRAELLRNVATDLARRLEAAPVRPAGADPAQRMRSVARVLNSSPPEMEKKVIEALAQSDEGTANELREHLFSWEDLGALNRRAITKVLGTVDTKTLSVALKGCSPAVEKAILTNLSSRAREVVLEERELAGPLPIADVRAARAEILKNVRGLIEAGEFRPTRGGEELVS